MKTKAFHLVVLVLALFSVGLLLAVLGANAAATAASHNSGWIDHFDNPALDPRWTWVNEDPAFWSLTAHPGFLRITTQEGAIRTNSGRNVLVAWPNLDDMQIETKVTFTPTENVLNASLIVYQDDDNYVQIARYYASGDKIRLRVEIGGQLQSEFNVNETATTVYLRLVKFNNFYIGSYSTDGSNWIEVARVSAVLSSPRVGVTASGGSSSLAIPADFDYFQLSALGNATLYVAPGGNCGGASPCYATIQGAVDAANELDVIKVTAGTYTDLHVRPRNDVTTTGVITQVVYISKTVAIGGGYTPTNWITSNLTANPTTLDAQGQGRVIYITGDIGPVIEGLRITGGDATRLGGEWFNDLDMGGGVYVWRSMAALKNNVVFSNTFGGIAMYGPGENSRQPGATIQGNTIISNTGSGGLLLGWTAVYMSDNIVRGNTSQVGGGAMNIWVSNPTLERNIIQANHAKNNYAGGIHVQTGELTFINNVLADNQVDQSSNKGSALSVVGAKVYLSHNTLARNTGGNGSIISVIDFPGIPSTVFMTNTILVSQSVGLSANGVSTVTVNGILWYNTPITVSKDVTAVVTVNNQFTGNPLFTEDGYHLSLNSAAMERGVNSGVRDDIDGKPRPRGPGYDLGADEFWWEMVYLPLVLK